MNDTSFLWAKKEAKIAQLSLSLDEKLYMKNAHFIFFYLVLFVVGSSYLHADPWNITEPVEYVDVPVQEPIQEEEKPSRGLASLPSDSPEKSIEKSELIKTKSFSIIATKDSFLPDTIYLSTKTPAELSVMSQDLESCLVIPQLGIRMGLKKGRLEKISIPAQKEEKIIEFHCALNNLKGKIVIESTDKFKSNKNFRKITSNPYEQ